MAERLGLGQRFEPQPDTGTAKKKNLILTRSQRRGARGTFIQLLSQYCFSHLLGILCGFAPSIVIAARPPYVLGRRMYSAFPLLNGQSLAAVIFSYHPSQNHFVSRVILQLSTGLSKFHRTIDFELIEIKRKIFLHLARKLII